jgi:PTS system fructose-specific IIC component
VNNVVTLSDVFHRDCIMTLHDRPTKPVVIERLLSSLDAAGLLAAAEVPGLAQAMLARERVGTTALGHGFALPHLRTAAVRQFIGAIGLAPNGLDFDSLDGEPTHVVFLLLGPFDERERHFELMGELSSMVRDKPSRLFLRSRRSRDEVHEYLVDFDARSGAAADLPGPPMGGPAGTAARGPVGAERRD